MLGTSIAGAAGGYEQTSSFDAKCGPDSWSADNMAYAKVPCARRHEGNQNAKAPGGAQRAPC
jgi:hypothetical protein